METPRVSSLFVWLSLSLVGCGSAEPEPGRLTPMQFPKRDDFPVVAAAMQHRCGTLDCHGQVGRNLRLYGFGGLRLSTAEDPIGDPTASLTTVSELNASYTSTIWLEPEDLSRVLTQGADPNQLSMVRKTRGIEKHKGGQLAQLGDALDRCLVLWLTNKADPVPCEQVSSAPRPQPN